MSMLMKTGQRKSPAPTRGSEVMRGPNERPGEALDPYYNNTNRKESQAIILTIPRSGAAFERLKQRQRLFQLAMYHWSRGEHAKAEELLYERDKLKEEAL
nr:MAG TPA: hypothetical protein [Caudoviricetes sp.]